MRCFFHLVSLTLTFKIRSLKSIANNIFLCVHLSLHQGHFEWFRCPRYKCPDLWGFWICMAMDPGVNNEIIFTNLRSRCKKILILSLLLFFLTLLSVRGLVIAMLVSLLFLLLLRFTAPVMVWVLIIGLLGAGAYGKTSPFREKISIDKQSMESRNSDFENECRCCERLCLGCRHMALLLGVWQLQTIVCFHPWHRFYHQRQRLPAGSRDLAGLLWVLTKPPLVKGYCCV